MSKYLNNQTFNLVDKGSWRIHVAQILSFSYQVKVIYCSITISKGYLNRFGDGGKFGKAILQNFHCFFLWVLLTSIMRRKVNERNKWWCIDVSFSLERHGLLKALDFEVCPLLTRIFYYDLHKLYYWLISAMNKKFLFFLFRKTLVLLSDTAYNNICWLL